MRPSEIVSDAQDLVAIWEFVEAQAPRYGAIETPTVVVTGDADEVLSPEIHAKAMVAAVPGAKLMMLPGVGHMVQFAATERIVEVVAELSATERTASSPKCERTTNAGNGIIGGGQIGSKFGPLSVVTRISALGGQQQPVIMSFS